MDHLRVGDGIMAPILKLHDLTVAYNRYPAVHHLKGEFAGGALTAITGPNGAGKSTLLKTIAGILPVHEGSVEFCGITRKDMAYLPQAAELQVDFPLNVLQMVCSGFWRVSNGFQRISKQQRERAEEALAVVGLLGMADRTLGSLSAGQFQRALFARVIVQDAKLIMLDEPFTAMDAGTTDALLKVIHQWQGEGRTVISVLHDFDQIREHFPTCLLIARECIAWGKSQDVLKPENLVSARLFREVLPHRQH
ncbi:MAG TPA: ABC transporter ATP-binding protein [Rickettsiales bacterium]|nr:ABC transporter ATP-binding protein [Rickettsiales bacterium]